MGNHNSGYSYDSISDGLENYTGDTLNGNKHGKGTLKTRQGTYVGEFKNNKYNGKGKITFLNGNIYEGDFENDQIHGFGRCTYENGNIYVGNWKYGLQQGIGKMVYKSGDSYEGEWYQHKYHGQGKYTYKKQIATFEGFYKEGQRNGKGITTYINEQTLQANYQKGKLIYIYNLSNSEMDDKENIETRQQNRSISSTCNNYNACPICLTSMKSNTTFLTCGHGFHTLCIDLWIKKTHNCPICRSKLLTKVQVVQALLMEQSIQQSIEQSYEKEVEKDGKKKDTEKNNEKDSEKNNEKDMEQSILQIDLQQQSEIIKIPCLQPRRNNLKKYNNTNNNAKK